MDITAEKVHLLILIYNIYTPIGGKDSVITIIDYFGNYLNSICINDYNYKYMLVNLTIKTIDRRILIYLLTIV